MSILHFDPTTDVSTSLRRLIPGQLCLPRHSLASGNSHLILLTVLIHQMPIPTVSKSCMRVSLACCKKSAARRGHFVAADARQRCTVSGHLKYEPRG